MSESSSNPSDESAGDVPARLAPDASPEEASAAPDAGSEDASSPGSVDQPEAAPDDAAPPEDDAPADAAPTEVAPPDEPVAEAVPAGEEPVVAPAPFEAGDASPSPPPVTFGTTEAGERPYDAGPSAEGGPSGDSVGSSSPFSQRPELAVAAAFGGGLVLALILKRLAR